MRCFASMFLVVCCVVLWCVSLCGGVVLCCCWFVSGGLTILFRLFCVVMYCVACALRWLVLSRVVMCCGLMSRVVFCVVFFCVVLA